MRKDPYEDLCAYCGAHIGYGHPAFHLGNCGSDECNKKANREVPVGKPIKARIKKGTKA